MTERLKFPTVVGVLRIKKATTASLFHMTLLFLRAECHTCIDKLSLSLPFRDFFCCRVTCMVEVTIT